MAYRGNWSPGTLRWTCVSSCPGWIPFKDSLADNVKKWFLPRNWRGFAGVEVWNCLCASPLRHNGSTVYVPTEDSQHVLEYTLASARLLTDLSLNVKTSLILRPYATSCFLSAIQWSSGRCCCTSIALLTWPVAHITASWRCFVMNTSELHSVML